MDCIDKNSIYSLFWRIMRTNFIRSHDLFEQYNVYPGQPPLLINLYFNDGQSQVQLANALHLKPSTITVMIQRLEKNNMVCKKNDVDDKRISRIFLTEHGHTVCKELIKINQLNEKVCIENMSIEEQIILKRLLLQVLDNLSTHSNHKGADSTC